MTYKLKYGHTWGLPNYASERVEIEREFSNSVPSVEALKLLERETVKDYEELKKSRGGKQ